MMGRMKTTSPPATLGERLTFAMALRGTTANAIDVALKKNRYTAYIANGRTINPGLEALEQMANHLDVDCAWLAFGKGDLPVARAPVRASAA